MSVLSIVAKFLEKMGLVGKEQAAEAAKEITGEDIRALHLERALERIRPRMLKRGPLGKLEGMQYPGGRRETRAIAEASYRYWTPDEYKQHCKARNPWAEHGLYQDGKTQPKHLAKEAA